MADKRSRSFKDITLDFKPHPVTGDLMVLKNERAINRSIRNLVQTGLSERYYARIGTDIYGSLFGFVDEATAGVIAQEIYDVIGIFEPRVSNPVVLIDPKPDENTFNVKISYEIVGADFPRQNYNFILEATR
tara:strand:- start:678 stop:1073 length:396 start_codon:yes stop_codon:yes gene_type:complete